MNAPLTTKPERRAARRRMPTAGWIVLGVVAFHAVAFWVVADRHFLPKVPRVPPPQPANFGAGQRTSVDPQTGEVTTETQYVVSTRLASPAPTATP